MAEYWMYFPFLTLHGWGKRSAVAADELFRGSLEVMEELSQRRIARGEEIDVKAAWERFTHGKGLEYFKDFNG